MEKYFNMPAVVIGLFGGFLGGFDKLTHAVILFMIIDYLSATLIAIYNKQLSSEIGFKGIIKKIFILLTIGVAVEVNKIVPDIPLREMVLSFYIANEGISILENICKINTVPQELKQVFLQLRGDNDKWIKIWLF